MKYRRKGSDHYEFVTGANHTQCMNAFSTMGLYRSDREPIGEVQGFVDNEGNFHDRREAYEIADQAGQLLGPSLSRILFSENVKY